MPLWLVVKPLLYGALGVLRKVPVWAWVLLAVLAWGGWQRHSAKAAERKHTKAVAEAAAERETKLKADATETARRLEAQKGITDEAKQKAFILASDAARARAAEQQLRARIAALTSNARAADPAASAGGAAAGEAGAMLADVLGRCIGRVREVAEYADAARTAGEACEAAYKSLNAPK